LIMKCLDLNMKYDDFVKDIGESYFSPIDTALADLLAGQVGEDGNFLFLAAALVSNHLQDGHICLDLNTVAGRELSLDDENKTKIICPPLKCWINKLKKFSCVGSPGEFKPLILDKENRMYLQRYWRYENDVARIILSRQAQALGKKFDKKELQERLAFYFPDDPRQKINWQKVAAVAALQKKFLVISGSPGTGKTTAIIKIIAFVLEMEKRNLRIALAAPTGKAAARLRDSVIKAKAQLNCGEEISCLIPNETTTIHRLLGSVGMSAYFRFNDRNPLPHDLVVIDEASMVDIPLMAKLLTALSDDTRIILAGDKDQLVSVEAGAVLSDICRTGLVNIYSEQFAGYVTESSGQPVESCPIPEGIQDCIVQLKENYRFSTESGISALSDAVKNGGADTVINLLRNNRYADVSWTETDGQKNLIPQLRQKIMDGYEQYLKEVNYNQSAERIIDCFEQFRILCALRVGNWGSQKINSYVEKILADDGAIRPYGEFYPGLPVMIVKNDYRSRLFNGDTGVILRDKENSELLAFFRDEQGRIRKIIPALLPETEKAWAMTVHKSQGSEFDKALLILPDTDAAVLSRELVYTGITRARKNVEIWASENVLRRVISRRIIRQTGLSSALGGQLSVL